MYNLNVITSALVRLVLVTTLVGSILGLLLSNTDIANFMRNRAEAERVRSDIQWQNNLREIELPYLKAERAAQSAEVIAESNGNVELINAQTQAEITRIVGKARFETNVQDLVIILGRYLGMGISIGFSLVFTYFLIRLSTRLIPLTSSKSHDTHNWDEPGYRNMRIFIAKELERFHRRQKINQAGQIQPTQPKE